MATRSHIGIRNLDGTIDYVYCHWDGYPQHNGVILVENYKTVNQVRALLELGSLSVLGKTLGEKQDFSDPAPNTCVAYHRDRGEAYRGPSTCTYEELIKDDNVDYVYIFDGDYWECVDTYNNTREINLYENINQ